MLQQFIEIINLNLTTFSGINIQITDDKPKTKRRLMAQRT